MDAGAIKAVQSGTRQLSFAHTGTVTVQDGVTPDGEHYDAIQTDIVFTDHLAIVPEGRGGPTLSIGDGKITFHSKFSDGTPDFTSPHRKGFRFADNSDADPSMPIERTSRCVNVSAMAISAVNRSLRCRRNATPLRHARRHSTNCRRRRTGVGSEE